MRSIFSIISLKAIKYSFFFFMLTSCAGKIESKSLESKPLEVEQFDAQAQEKSSDLLTASKSQQAPVTPNVKNNSATDKANAIQAELYFQKAETYLSSGVDVKSYSQALLQLRKARDLGHEKASAKIDWLEGYLPFEQTLKSRYRTALRLAKKGDVDAQEKLAQMCEFGLGVRKDLNRAINWYKKAANNGSGFAQLRLGEIYASSQFQALGDKGEIFASELIQQNSSPIITPKSSEPSKPKTKALNKSMIDWITLAAEKGEAEAQYKLAGYYLLDKPQTINGNLVGGAESSSTETIQYNPKQAFYWYKKSAQGGYVLAQMQTGLMLKTGLGVKQNYEAALVWFEKALQQSYEPARPEIQEVNKILDDLFIESFR